MLFCVQVSFASSHITYKQICRQVHKQVFELAREEAYKQAYKDTCVWYLGREEIFRSEDIPLGGPRCLIAKEAVDKHDTAGAYG